MEKAQLEEEERLFENARIQNENLFIDDYVRQSAEVKKLKKLGFRTDGVDDYLKNYYRATIIEWGYDIDKIDKLIS